MTPHTTYLIGWALLGCMGVTSMAIIAPGLVRAMRILLPSALPVPPAVANPQPRVRGDSARPTSFIQGGSNAR